ncbi:subtilisin-like protease SDD1-like protein [Trifolium pratense]|uniref:Subtilisin-like protease SDD1-like protein n=1 Tax=Trifolium pratense TaxID=57577 RepID=A0A2K3NGG4_TRIPR|nr:subtilisin-like protease SDD1-like protein [Trifolium pratense]
MHPEQICRIPVTNLGRSNLASKGLFQRTKFKVKWMYALEVSTKLRKGSSCEEAAGASMILANKQQNLEEDAVDGHVLPAILSRAPAVAIFSARRQSFTNPSILKPDVIAPGVNIIAAWPQNLGPIDLPEDTKSVSFSVIALDPRLIYNIRPDDYVNHHCSIGYTRIE